MRFQVAVLLLATACLGGCGASHQQSQDIEALRLEIKADRELLAQTKAELDKVIEVLRPLSEMAKFVQESGMLQPDALDHLPPQDVSDAPPMASVEASDSGMSPETLRALVDESITSPKPNTYTIKRKFINALIEDPMLAAQGARVVPSIKMGKPNGFKLYAIRPSSVYAALGLMNGDTIHSINGLELDSPDNALEAFAKLRDADSLSVRVIRRGKPVTLTMNIVD